VNPTVYLPNRWRRLYSELIGLLRLYSIIRNNWLYLIWLNLFYLRVICWYYDLCWILGENCRLFDFLIKIIFLIIILVTLLLFNLLIWLSLNNIQISLLLIIIRYGALKSMSFKSENLTLNLKTDSSSFRTNNHILFNHN
jgi:hypothetical protein